MGVVELLSVLIPLAVKYGPSAVEAVHVLMAHLEQGGELSGEEADALHRQIADASRRIQQA